MLTFALQLAVLYLPVLQSVFRTDALSSRDLAVCLGASTVVFVGVELEKLAVHRCLLYAAVQAVR